MSDDMTAAALSDAVEECETPAKLVAFGQYFKAVRNKPAAWEEFGVSFEDGKPAEFCHFWNNCSTSDAHLKCLKWGEITELLRPRLFSYAATDTQRAWALVKPAQDAFCHNMFHDDVELVHNPDKLDFYLCDECIKDDKRRHVVAELYEEYIRREHPDLAYVSLQTSDPDDPAWQPYKVCDLCVVKPGLMRERAAEYKRAKEENSHHEKRFKRMAEEDKGKKASE